MQSEFFIKSLNNLQLNYVICSGINNRISVAPSRFAVQRGTRLSFNTFHQNLISAAPSNKDPILLLAKQIMSTTNRYSSEEASQLLLDMIGNDSDAADISSDDSEEEDERIDMEVLGNFPYQII